MNRGIRYLKRNPKQDRWVVALITGLAFCLISIPTPAAKLRLGVQPGLRYDPVALHVQPGEEVELLFDNTDEMMHNFALVSPGSRMEIVEAAIALGSDGPSQHYVPSSPKVLASTPVVLPGKKAKITFEAPSEEGEYPYVCTFPGHGFVMFGTLFVAKERPNKMDQVLARAKAETTTNQVVLSNPSTSATAVVHRTFMPNSSPAAIAVSLPGGHAYCWDAGNCRLRYVWREGFIKKNGSFGRWRTLPTIEGRIYYWEFRFPFTFEGKIGLTEEPRFLGYRLVGGIPEFRYQVGGAEITEFLAKLPGKSGLTRRFTVTNAPSDLLYELNPDAGVQTTCDKGKVQNGIIRLTMEEAKDFTLTLKETPGKAPLLYLSMNDLAACYNRKGNLHEGAIGQAWQLNGGKPVVPAQSAGDFSKGAALSVWVKLTEPSKPIPSLVGWQKGGALQYTPSKKPYSFGANASKLDLDDDGLEAEHAKFKGPSRNSNHGGHMGDGYLDFGDQIGEFVEWTAKVEKAGEHILRFRYATSDVRPLELKVDGETDLLSPNLSFQGSGGWTSWSYLSVKRNLTAGQHVVRLTSIKPTGPNIDRLEIVRPNDKRRVQPKTQQVADTPTMDNDWHLLTMTMDTKDVRVYLDKELQHERPRNAGEDMPAGTIALTSSAKSPRFFLDELRVYERTLSLAEIKRLVELRTSESKKQ